MKLTKATGTSRGLVTSTFDIQEIIPFSPEDQLFGMYVSETTNDTEHRRLLLKGPPEAVKGLVSGSDMADFTASGHQTFWFAEATLTEGEWRKLVQLTTEDQNYRRSLSSSKVETLKEKFFPTSLRVIGSVGLLSRVSPDVQEILKTLGQAGIKVAVTMESPHEQTKPIIEDLRECLDIKKNP